MIRYLIIFIRTRTRAYAIYYLKIRDTMKNNKKNTWHADRRFVAP